MKTIINNGLGHLFIKKNKTERYKVQKSEEIQCYLMLATQIIGFLLFTLYPLIWAARLAFFYYDSIPSHTNFVGLENFIHAFTKDSAYWKTWLTTLQFAAIKLPFELPLAMLVAVILNKKMRLTGFFRAVFYMPHIISVTIVGLVFSNLFSYFGAINALMMKFNLNSIPIDWFGEKTSAIIVLALGSAWCTFGVNMIFFLSALQTIPADLYESAYLDGASKTTIFFKITLPMIAPVLQTILLLSINSTLHVNEYILVTTRGAPGGQTFTVMSYLVQKFVPGFVEGNLVNIGYGCMLSLITSIIMCLVAIIYSKLSKKLSTIY